VSRSREASPKLAMATFLMTDIEGSTRLWETQPDAMAVVLERHDGILRDLVGNHGGEVVKTTGDGMLAAFADPLGAAEAAVDGQRRLASLSTGSTPILVRMALHTGSAQVRDDDYFGPALNRVARLLAIGHGGQILVSGVTAALVRDRLATDIALIDHGDQVLRDLAQPEHVHQLVADGLARQFPPLRSAAVSRSNLPVQVTSFVGREAELAEIERLVEAHRMVTLIGTGGTGKTRLMLEAAPRIEARYPDGVRLAELAPTSDPDLVASEVIRAVGGRERPGSTAMDTLLDLVRDKRMLLLLDNCEHVIGSAADLAWRVLTNCPATAILATSREALGIEGEQIFQVPSLGFVRAERTVVDGMARHDRLPEIAAAGAVRLFVDRAAAVAPGFVLTPDNAPIIAEICERLDGIPLAIELAAARVAVLSVDDILARLGDRFRLLTGGRRTAVPRQQTLQALVDWSWDLLDEPERRLLRRLSVFAGGWTLDAAWAVCAEPGEDVTDTLDLLERLVERSLVDVDRSGRATRYRLLETMRQYARDRLTERDEADVARRRHLTHFTATVESLVPTLMGPASGDALATIDAEIDNVRAAIEWGLEADAETTGRLCVALWNYWRSRVTGEESAVWLTEAAERVAALPVPDGPTAARARAILVARLHATAAFALATRSNRPSIPMAEKGLELARALDDDHVLLDALSAQWTTRFFAGETDRLRALAEEQLMVAERIGDVWMTGAAEMTLANEYIRSDPTRARALMESAARHAQQTGAAFSIGFVGLNRGRLLAALGDIDEARTAFDAAFAAYTEVGDDGFALATRSDLGHALRDAGRLDEAEAVYRSTIPGWERLGNRGAIANQLESFAFIAIERGDDDRAARLLGAAEALRDASGARMIAREGDLYATMTDRLRARSDPTSLSTAWQAGRSMTTAAAIDLAISPADGGASG